VTPAPPAQSGCTAYRLSLGRVFDERDHERSGGAESDAKSSERGGPSKQQAQIIAPGLDVALRTAGLNPDDPQVTKAIQISLMMISGGALPLPPPSILAEYEKAYPGIVSKIIEWTEQQRAHRQALERQRTEGSERRMNRGQIIAGTVAVSDLVLAALTGAAGAT